MPHKPHIPPQATREAKMTKIEHFLEKSKKWVDSHPYLTDTIIIVTIPTVILASIYYFGPTSGWRERNAWVAASYFSTLATVTSLLSLRHKKSLFLAIAFWTLLSIACYTALSWLWGGRFLAGWTNEKSLTFKELLSTTLAAVGGIGAVGYLVIKYREQASTEREEARQNEGAADKQLTAAVKQLGSKSPQVRIAGIYALADMADTYGSEKHGVNYDKRVVEILCGYLRTYRLTSSALDYATESTIWDVVSSHTRTPYASSPGRWSPLDLDIHKTVLVEEVKLGGAHINSIHFQGTTLKSRCSLTGLSTIGEADFNGATFSETADFSFTKLGYANFNNAHFESYAYFSSAEFKRAPWMEHLLRSTHFAEEAEFRATTFYCDIRFTGSVFDKRVSFGCLFCTPGGCESPNNDSHGGASFIGEADFSSVRFVGAVDFSNATFAGAVNFSGATFEGGANFNGSAFNIDLKDQGKISFPQGFDLSEEGLPKGAKWAKFDNKGKPLPPNIILPTPPTGPLTQDED